MKSMRIILAALRRADHEFGLIKQDDKIMVGVSGGKDSLILCHALSLYQKFPHTNFSFQPVLLNLGFPNTNFEPLINYFKSQNLELKIVDCHEVYQILQIQKKDKLHLSCSICSRMKKAAINKVAKELGFNKVAFAHHADDAIETFFMNTMYGGRIATFAPYMHLENANIDFIRPFIYVRESDIINAAKELSLPVLKTNCPNDKHTMRQTTKEYLEKIYHNYPFCKENFLKMLSCHEHLDIWIDKLNYSIEGTNLSFCLAATKNQLLDVIKIYQKEHKRIPNIDEGDFYLLKKDNKTIGTVLVKIDDKTIVFKHYQTIKHSGYNLKNAFIPAIEKHIQIKRPDAKKV